MRFTHRTLRGAMALTVATFLFAPTSWASPLTETVGDGRGTIDWTHGTLTVTGSGAPPDSGSLAQKRLLARRAAVLDGYRQLAELITGVRVNSETVVKDFVIESDTIKTQVNALVKGAQAAEPRYLSDGSVEVDVTVSLYGPTSLFAAVDFDHKIAKPAPQPSTNADAGDSEPPAPAATPTPKPTPAKPETPVAKPTPKPSARPTANPEEETPPELTKPTPAPSAKPSAATGKPGAVSAPARPNAAKDVPAGGYTGVIIDCTEINVQPAMSPTILDENGKELYVGKLPIDPDQVINVGIVGYASSMEEASSNTDRVGKNPLVLKAARPSGQYKADIILSTADSSSMLSANETGKFLAQSHVMFVLRP